MSIIEINDQNFEQEVIKAGKPVLLDFWAPWCGPCRMVGPIVEQIGEEYGKKIKVGKLNTEQSQKVAATFGIRSIPTVMLFDGPDVVDAIIGARPKTVFQKMIDRHLKKVEKRHRKEEKMQRKVKASA
ncbi:MAG TPA: thioredoxin [Myxococcota bacterium]|nr:thioredoxin [Myxococcota bacterium]